VRRFVVAEKESVGAPGCGPAGLPRHETMRDNHTAKVDDSVLNRSIPCRSVASRRNCL